MKPIQALYRKQLNSVMATRQIDDLSRSAIIFAPHPDDETLGCGGTIIRKVAAGARVRIVFMTDGSRSHAGLMDEAELKDIRQQEALAATTSLGGSEENVTFLGVGDGRLAQSEQEAGDGEASPTENRIQEILTAEPTQEVFIPHRLDSQPDHVATHNIVVAALVKQARPVAVYSYPVWYWRHWPWTSLLGSSKRETLNILKATAQSGLGTEVFRVFGRSVYVVEVRSQKKTALSKHATQMQRRQPNWPILSDVANGDFLDCFLQDYEIFHQLEVPTAGGLPI